MSRGIYQNSDDSIWFYTPVKNSKTFKEENLKIKLFNEIDGKRKVTNAQRKLILKT